MAHQQNPNPSPLVAWKNGHWLPLDQASPSLADTGWVQGVTVVDVLRTVQGEPFLLDRHLDRFFRDCKSLAIETRWNRETMAEVVYQLLVKNKVGPNPHRAWSIILLATPGPLPTTPPANLRGQLKLSTDSHCPLLGTALGFQKGPA